MGHCGKLGYALWVTTVNLVAKKGKVMLNVLVKLNTPSVKICDNYCPVGHTVCVMETEPSKF
jgi:hypothetical protein